MSEEISLFFSIFSLFSAVFENCYMYDNFNNWFEVRINNSSTSKGGVSQSTNSAIKMGYF